MTLPLDLSTNKFVSLDRCKTILKRHIRVQDHDSVYSSLKSSNNDILQINYRLFDTQLFNLSDKKYDSLCAWKLGITQYDRVSPFEYSKIEVCNLCLSHSNYPLQQHLLSECPATVLFLESYYEQLRNISKSYHERLCSLNINNRWLWILRFCEFCNVKVNRKMYPILEENSVSYVNAVMDHKLRY